MKECVKWEKERKKVGIASSALFGKSEFPNNSNEVKVEVNPY